ncbi:MAG: hypothetical protein KDC34_18835 [Saprospiraceae bacterium]|nr:hypothetical protein [Saprospiraceae bacterium]
MIFSQKFRLEASLASLAFSGQRSVKKQVLPIAIGMIYPSLHHGKDAAGGNVSDYSLKFRDYSLWFMVETGFYRGRYSLPFFPADRLILKCREY